MFHQNNANLVIRIELFDLEVNLNMTKRLLSTLLASSLVFSVCSPAGFAAQVQNVEVLSTTEITSQTIISLDETSKANIVELFENSDIAELQTMSTIGGQTYTTGYVMTGIAELDEAIATFEERYLNLLIEAKEAYEDCNPEMYAIFTARLKNYLEKGMSISAVVIDGELDEQVAQKANSKEFVKRIDSVCTTPSNNSQTKAIPKAVSTSGNWIPTSGSAVVWNSNVYDDAVYMNLNWTWDSDADMSFYQSTNNITLEAEIVFNNNNGLGHSVQWYSGDWTYDTNQPGPLYRYSV